MEGEGMKKDRGSDFFDFLREEVDFPFLDRTPIISESFHNAALSPEEMDFYWSQGWRHFGPLFVRYSYSSENHHLQVVQPLRVSLDRFTLSRSHRRVLRRNTDLEVRIKPTVIDAERAQLFDRHKGRFESNVPVSLDDFLGSFPSRCPCENIELGAYLDGRLVAASYLDLGREGVSSVYAMFCPSQEWRSLGIATMLWEMNLARERGSRFYYPGYAFHEPSRLDYKKQFRGLEWYNWRGRWLPLE